MLQIFRMVKERLIEWTSACVKSILLSMWNRFSSSNLTSVRCSFCNKYLSSCADWFTDARLLFLVDWSINSLLNTQQRISAQYVPLMPVRHTAVCKVNRVRSLIHLWLLSVRFPKRREGWRCELTQFSIQTLLKWLNHAHEWRACWRPYFDFFQLRNSQESSYLHWFRMALFCWVFIFLFWTAPHLFGSIEKEKQRKNFSSLSGDHSVCSNAVIQFVTFRSSFRQQYRTIFDHFQSKATFQSQAVRSQILLRWCWQKCVLSFLVSSWSQPCLISVCMVFFVTLYRMLFDRMEILPVR